MVRLDRSIGREGRPSAYRPVHLAFPGRVDQEEKKLNQVLGNEYDPWLDTALLDLQSPPEPWYSALKGIDYFTDLMATAEADRWFAAEMVRTGIIEEIGGFVAAFDRLSTLQGEWHLAIDF